MTYGIAFLVFRRVMELYSPVCMPELLKIICYTPAAPYLPSIQKHYENQLRNWHDIRLALLLAVPVTPDMRIDPKKCKKVVEEYLFNS